jgi:Leucine-rich repeat (LRR) protein
MKNTFRSSLVMASFSFLAFSGAPLAQDLKADTLAIRIILDENGLISVPVAQVSDIDPAKGRVTALRLGSRKLTVLPTEIGVLDGMKYLVLNNNLLDSLPAALWGLGNLVELDLGGNRIAMLDARVGRLKSLLYLALQGNGLTSLPDSIFALPQLETLILADNVLDTLPEDVAELAFLKYLDVSGNGLRALPFTLAAMQSLDTLDVSGNVIESLPGALTQMRAAAKVMLGGNRLCDLDATMAAWANSKDAAWRSSQNCGIPIRPRARSARGPSLRAWSEAGRVRLDWSGIDRAGPRSVILRDAAGRELLRQSAGTDAAGMTLPRTAAGFLWAELRAGDRVLARTAVGF